MSATSPMRLDFLATAAAASAATLPPGQTAAAGGGDTIRAFQVSVPDEQLVTLRRRIAATRWPDRETVDDPSQGVQLAELQELARYWGTEYDWRKAEAKLNALPQFVTTIGDVGLRWSLLLSSAWIAAASGASGASSSARSVSRQSMPSWGRSR